MTIYTGYFAKMHTYNGIKLPIAAILPSYYQGTLQYKDLAPSKELLFAYHKEQITKEEFIRKFKNKLNNLDKGEVYKYLTHLEYYDDVYLLCYEKPYEFCHRHIVAEWLNENFDLEVKEYLPYSV